MSTMNALINGADFYPGIPEDAYHADLLMDEPTLSSGVANLLVARSPLHAWTAHPRLNSKFAGDEEVTKEMDRGRAIHALLLEGASDRIQIIAANDYRTNDAKAQRDIARAAGKIPLLTADFERVRDTTLGLAAQLAHTELAGMMDAGETELTAVWQEGPAWCRSRFDWISRDRSLLVDLKTTSESSEPNSFIRRIAQMGYDLQCAMYCRAVERITGKTPRFLFLVVETEAPYAISVVGLEPEWMAFSSRKVESAIAIWSECMASGRWPSYPTRVCWASLPAWAQAAYEEREAMSIDWDKQANAVVEP